MTSSAGRPTTAHAREIAHAREMQRGKSKVGRSPRSPNGKPAGKPIAKPIAKPAAKPLGPTVSRPELLVGGSDREFRHLVHGLFGFLACHETIRAGHARFIRLAGIEYTVLISIAHLAADGAVSVSAVAAHLHLTGAFITTVCQRLITLGLIEKTADMRDRRRVSLTVAAEGRRRLQQLAPVQRQVNDAEFACLTRDEFRSLIDIVDRLIACGEQAIALQRYLHATVGPADHPVA